MHKPTQLVKKRLTEEGSKVKMEVHTRKRRNYGDASLPSYKEARSGKRISAKNLKAWQWMEARCRVFETFGTNDAVFPVRIRIIVADLACAPPRECPDRYPGSLAGTTTTYA